MRIWCSTLNWRFGGRGDETPLPTKARHVANPWERQNPYALDNGSAPAVVPPAVRLICDPRDVPEEFNAEPTIAAVADGASVATASSLDVALTTCGKARRGGFLSPGAVQVAQAKHPIATTGATAHLSTTKQVTKIVQSEIWNAYLVVYTHDTRHQYLMRNSRHTLHVPSDSCTHTLMRIATHAMLHACC